MPKTRGCELGGANQVNGHGDATVAVKWQIFQGFQVFKGNLNYTKVNINHKSRPKPNFCINTSRVF